MFSILFFSLSLVFLGSWISCNGYYTFNLNGGTCETQADHACRSKGGVIVEKEVRAGEVLPQFDGGICVDGLCYLSGCL